MKDYSQFSVNDFVLDDFFQSWIFRPDEHSNAFWNQWLEDNPAKARDIQEAKNIIRALNFSSHSLSGEDVAVLWDRIKAFDSQSQQYLPSRKTSNGLLYKIAASILLCISVYIGYRQFSDASYLQYHTAFGETKTIVLPDSSTVILNSNSTLKFSKAWDQQPVRELWLEGEAYFSVVHKVDHQPFKVHTDEGVDVEVLGTTFNVYHRTDETKVVLNTGKIRLHLPEESASKDIMMKPGDFIEYKQKSFSKRNVNPAIYTAWTENKLILDRTSLREMISMLRNNYGIEVKVSSDELLNQTVSGSMPLTDEVSLVRQIAQTFQLKVTEQDDQFLMHE